MKLICSKAKEGCNPHVVCGHHIPHDDAGLTCKSGKCRDEVTPCIPYIPKDTP